MAENSAIEWTDHTFNPWVGCTKISPACDHCYAEGWAKRAGSPELWTGERRRTTEANWRQPLKWNAQAEAAGRRFKVFCASLADVFDNQVPDAWRADLWELIKATPRLDWLLLTKRPQNITRMVPALWLHAVWPANAWIGTTVANQTEADRNIPHLLELPARIRFLSIEPMLGPINLQRVQAPRYVPEDHQLDWKFDALSTGDYYEFEDSLGVWEGGDGPQRDRAISWVIAGGESGPGARPAHPDWFRALRDQCAAADVPFLFKQWGEHLPVYDRDVDDPDWRRCSEVERSRPKGRWLNLAGGHGFHGERVVYVDRLGKKAAGRLLDGELHDGVPA